MLLGGYRYGLFPDKGGRGGGGEGGEGGLRTGGAKKENGNCIFIVFCKV